LGPKAGVDAVAKRKNPITAPVGNRTPVVVSNTKRNCKYLKIFTTDELQFPLSQFHSYQAR